MSSQIPRDKLLLIAILALGAGLRFFRLAELPPGFQFDQAFYSLDLAHLLDGEFHIFFTAPGGSEPLFVYLALPFAALFGVDSPLAIKLTASIIGVLTLIAIYGFANALFDTRVALLSALFTAISFWHIFYNRYGERIPLTVLMATLTFWMFWRALNQRRTRDFILTGVFTGIALYTYPSARIIPIAIVALIAFYILVDRASARAYLVGLFAIGVTALIVFAPLGAHYLAHPDDFFSHTAEVSIFIPHGDVNPNILIALTENAIRVLKMFFITGDSGVLRNLPYRPIFDPFAGALFALGVIVWAFALDRRRAIWLAIWLGGALALSLISDDAPNNGRVMVGSPVVMLLPALGAVALWDRVQQKKIATTALGIFIALSATITARDYFDVFANSPDTYFAFDADKVETAQWLNQTAPRATIFLAPLWHQNGTISLLTRDTPLKSFESRDTIVLPGRADKDALYAFPIEQARKLETLATRLGSLGARAQATNANGAPLLLLYRVPAQNLPDENEPLTALAHGGDFLQPQARAHTHWGNLIELIGYTLAPEGAGGRNLTTTLFLRALNPIPDEYTFSIKARDEKNRVGGQDDKWAGNSSYATTQWQIGDIIIEKFYPGLNACAPAGNYRVTVEAYNPKTMQTLGEPIALGDFRAEASPGNLLEHLEPAQPLDVVIAPNTRLIGFTLAPSELRAGEEFSLALFWRGAGQHTVRVRVNDAILVEQTIQLPTQDRGLCTLFDLRAPSAGALFVNDLKIK
ncbi:MAG: glycosyltransferase family 39 protein [Chloroflexi bacterium]|nr:glycosyltransferase family 39 protein [Chloroflexota bacterium]